MVFGLAPSTATTDDDKEKDDLARVVDILDKCGMQEICRERGIDLHRKKDVKSVSVKRVKAKQNITNKPEPIVVTFKDLSGFDDIYLDDPNFTLGQCLLRPMLRNAKGLKDTKWNGVFLAPDLTPLDREYGKRLRAERDRLNSALSEQTRTQFRYGVRGSQVVKILA